MEAAIALRRFLATLGMTVFLFGLDVFGNDVSSGVRAFSHEGSDEKLVRFERVGKRQVTLL